MDKISIGIVGTGIGRKHIQGYREHPLAEVVALCDLDRERLAKTGEQYGVSRQYTSLGEMLQQEKLDVVSITTPNKYHQPLTIEALESGCHVLCEKPMAMNAGEAREMLAVAERTGKRIMINFSYRFTPAARALKRQVEAGEVGDIYFGRTVWHRRSGMPGFGGWFGQKALAGGGPLIDLGVHRLDLALWLMGYPQPQWVFGRTYNKIAGPLADLSKKHFDVEDLAVALIQFTNGATLEVEASWAAHIGEKELMETRLLGTRGGLIHRNSNQAYEFESWMFNTREHCQQDIQLHVDPATVPSAMHHFVDCIVTDQPHIATGEEGLVVMQLLDAIYASAEQGEPIKL